MGRLAFVAGCCVGFTGIASPAQATCATDTVVVYGSTRFYGAGGYPAYTLYDPEYFSTTTSWGRRYIIELRNGSPALSGVTVTIDGREWIGTDEFGTGVSYLTRTVDFADGSHSHSIELSVQGGSSAYVDVRVYHVTEPMFKVYGRKIFIKPSPAAAQLDSFTIASGAKAGYKMRVFNGDSTGSHRTNNCTVKLNNVEILASYEFTTGTVTLTRDVTLLGGGSQNRVEVNNQGASSSRIDVEFTATDSTAPVIAVSSPAEGFVTEASSVSVAGSITDETPVTVTINGGTAINTNTTFSQSFSMPSDGNYTITIHAANSACFTSDSVRHVARDNLAPAFTVRWPTSALASSDSTSIALAGYWADTIMTYITVDGDTIASGKSGAFNTAQAYPLDLGPNRIVLRAIDALGHATTLIRLAFRTTVGEGSPPTLTATGLGTTEIQPFLSRVRFLYGNGSPPIQTDVSDTTVFAPDRAAVVHGKVIARDFGALPNVTVQVLDHPEYGATKTRSDGQFDMVVNGGARLVLRFLKDEYLEAQRELDVPINDFTVVDSLAMIGRSAKWFYADTTAARTIVGRFESDLSGDRRISLLIPSGTLATITPSGGSPITGVWKYRIRLKEFTVGTGGPVTMPSFLPATTAYTYCVDLSLVEADSVTAHAGLGSLPAAVEFSKSIVTYVKDFLSLPVGTVMPSGYYDPWKARWVAEENGRIIKVLSTAGGVASLDTDGNGVADTLAQYIAAGIDTVERTKIATLFSGGDTLWRDPIRHFSTHDFNLNTGTTNGLGSSTAANAGVGSPQVPDPDTTCACVIENENRVLGETIPIKGTPFTLNYRSSRQFGDKAGRWLRIPLTGSTIPVGLVRVHLQVDVAGKRYKEVYSSITTNDVRIFSSWDGNDIYGRKVPGSVTATVKLGYEFKQSLSLQTSGSGSYGNSSSTLSANGRLTTGDRDIGLFDWITQKVSVGAPSMASAGLGGWTLSPHHFYDTNGRGTLYLGDGGVRYGYQQYPIISRFAGTGAYAAAGPDTTANKTTVPISPGAIAFGPDGSLFFVGAIGLGTGAHHVVFRIRPNGTLIPWAGCLSCDEGIATNDPQDGDFAISTTKRLALPNGLAVGRDGSVYISDEGWRQVYRISPDDSLHVVAGKYSLGTGGFVEGALAKPHALSSPSAVAVGPDGSIYVADAGYRRVIRIGADGIMHSFAGDSCCAAGTVGKADSLMLNSNLNVSGIAVSPEGDVYLADGTKLWLVTRDGQVRALNGPGHGVAKLALGLGGELYIGTGVGYSGVVRRDRDTTLSTIAGTYPDVISGSFVPADFAAEEGGFAQAARLEGMGGVAVGPDGNVYVSQVGTGSFTSGFGIRVIASQLPGQLNDEIAYPSEDGREVYYFTLTGRHLRTMDVTTGVTLFAFDYDGAGRLIRVRDADGDTSWIQRNGSGDPLAIVGPYRQRTKLTLDGNGYLTEARDSLADEAYTLDCASDGLLQHFTNPRSKQQTFTYGASDGRLESDEDAASAMQTLDHEDAGLTQTVTRTTEGPRTTSYQVTRMLDGLRHRLVNYPSHGWTYRADSINASTSPYGDVTRQVGTAGEVTLTYPTRDMRFGMLAQTPATVYLLLPSGLRRTLTASRDTAVSGVITETRGVNGNVFNTTFTQSTKTILTTSPEGRTSTVALDAAGRPVSVSVGSTVTPVSISYDGRGRVASLTQGGRALRYGYDVNGRLQVLRDTLGRMAIYGYSNADRVSGQLLPGGGAISYDYDANGNLTSLTPPSGAAHSFGYTDVDLTDIYTPPTVVGISDPATRYAFNSNRQLTRVTRPDGGVISAHYVSSTGLCDSLTQGRGRNPFTYTSNGQLLTAGSPDSVMVVYGYDGPLLRAEAWTGLLGGAVDSVSVRSNIAFTDSIQTINGSSPASYAYDADGLLASVTVNGSTETISRRSDDGFISGTNVDNVTSSQSYNSHGELWKLSYAWAGGGGFQQVIDRDSVGRIIKVTESGISTAVYDYHYDVAGRVDSVVVGGSKVAGYTYDANGNRIAFRGVGSADTATATYDAQDRMLRYGRTAFVYTANGELARKIGVAGDTTRYTYDAFGNLIGAHLPTGDSLVYMIDGENRRVARKLNGTRTNTWLYQGERSIVAELDTTGAILNRYAYGTSNQTPDLMVRGGTTFCLIRDQLGSIRAVVNASSGAVVQQTEYDPWGGRIMSNAPNIQALGYAGGLTDSATALVRFGARDYDPSVGRWTSKDPLTQMTEFEGLYTYVGNAPTNDTDESGLLPDYLERFLAQLKCADAKAQALYGSWLSYSDASGVLGGPAVLLTLLQEGVVSLTDLFAFNATWAARLKGAVPGLTHGASDRLSREGAEEAARLATLRSSLTWVSQATGLVSAFATGFSIGARVAFWRDCDCPKPASK